MPLVKSRIRLWNSEQIMERYGLTLTEIHRGLRLLPLDAPAYIVAVDRTTYYNEEAIHRIYYCAKRDHWEAPWPWEEKGWKSAYSGNPHILLIDEVSRRSGLSVNQLRTHYRRTYAIGKKLPGGRRTYYTEKDLELIKKIKKDPKLGVKYRYRIHADNNPKLLDSLIKEIDNMGHIPPSWGPEEESGMQEKKKKPSRKFTLTSSVDETVANWVAEKVEEGYPHATTSTIIYGALLKQMREEEKEKRNDGRSS